ncbi:MAG TPA: ABC transporter ATP-binding protein [Polyangiaceae bacterium]|nr:ABC transporter ATP-binding protein [Polyangiaceae bacterium]
MTALAPGLLERDDARETPDVVANLTSWRPLLRCLAIYRSMPWRFGLTFLLFVVVNASLTVYQYLVGRAVHDVERGQAVVTSGNGELDYSVASHWLALLVGLAAARALLQYVGGIASLATGQELLFRLRDSILVQVQRLDLGYHLRHGIGEMVARTTRDADKVRDALISFWRNVIETGLVILASLGILGYYHPLLAVVPALLCAGGITLFLRQADVLVVLDRAVADSYDSVSQDLVEGVGGVRVIKAFSLEALRIARFDQAIAVFARHAGRAVRYAAAHVPIPQVVVALGQVWVFGLGAVLVGRQELNVGELVAATLAMNTLVFRFEGIGRVIQIFADARSSAGRIMDFLDAVPEILPANARLPEGPLGFRLRDVRVQSRDAGASRILDGCSLTVSPGETVALVGATGSGKSTLVSLLPRLLDPNLGRVEVGSEALGFHDVRSLDLGDLRARVHLATQDCFLFSDTVAHNVRLASADASDEELQRALEWAAAEEVVGQLPDGLATRIGDRGVTLSGGQRQRLALARALIARPAILILDDSTSALDAVTEQTILHNIRALAAQKGHPVTLFIVASKPSTVLYAGRTLVLENGRIVAEGSHEQLSRESATYRELMGLDDGAAV